MPAFLNEDKDEPVSHPVRDSEWSISVSVIDTETYPGNWLDKAFSIDAIRVRKGALDSRLLVDVHVPGDAASSGSLPLQVKVHTVATEGFAVMEADTFFDLSSVFRIEPDGWKAIYRLQKMEQS